MTTKRFIKPFGDDGLRVPVSDTPSGTDVNYETGYPEEYGFDPVTDPAARFVQLTEENQILHDITSNLKLWQENVFPDFITAENNGGVTWEYKKGDTVLYNGENYESLEDNNTDLPTTEKWVIKKPNEVLRAILIGLGYSGNYGFFEKGFVYREVGDLGFSSDGVAYIYAGVNLLPVTVPKSTDPESSNDYEVATLGKASSVTNDNGGTAQDQFNFKNGLTVNEAINYSGIASLIDSRVWLTDRNAWFKVVLTSTVTPDGARYIQSLSNLSYSFSLIISESMTLKNFGCVGDDSTINDSFIESAVNSGVNELDTGKSNQLYRFNSISIPRDIAWKGKGSLVGAALGTYPSISSMRSTNSNGRLALLQSYNPSSVVFTGTDGIYGDLTIKRALITTSGSDSLEIYENLNLVNCSMHNCYPYVHKQKAVLDAPLLIVSDSPDNGVKIERLGTAYMQFGRVYNPAVRGLNLVLSGFIDIQDGGVYDVLSEDSVLATQNSQIIMKRTEVKDGARVGVNLIYGSNADALDCVITGHEGAGLVCESNGSILAEGSTITGNGTNGTGAGVSTSYGGFIQCRYSTITGNGGPACENLTGGLIQAQGVIVDKSNNSGGFQFFSRAGGHILLDEMGDSNTPLLSNTDCYPTWGMIGAGGAFCGRDDNGIASRNGISVKRLYFGQRETQTISAGVITANDIYIQVANESSAATDDLDTITVDSNTPSEVMFISPANNGETLVIKHNTGNIISPNGLDITLDAKNRVAMLVLNPSTIKWIVTKF